jgi:hypothetical protein
MKDQQLQEFNSYFKTKWLEANTTLGIGLLRDQKITDARRYFWQTLSEQKFKDVADLAVPFFNEIDAQIKALETKTGLTEAPVPPSNNNTVA